MPGGRGDLGGLVSCAAGAAGGGSALRFMAFKAASMLHEVLFRFCFSLSPSFLPLSLHPASERAPHNHMISRGRQPSVGLLRFFLVLEYLCGRGSMRLHAGAPSSSRCAIGQTNLRSVRILLSAAAFSGAGMPRPDLQPQELPELLMTALKQNDIPKANAGLESMWAFAGDTTRFIYQNNMTEFIEDAHKTASSLPTSFYGTAMNGKAYVMEGDMSMCGGNEDPWIATQVMRTISCDGRMRRWQWELRKHRRPPNLGSWFVESIGSSDRRGNFDVEG